MNPIMLAAVSGFPQGQEEGELLVRLRDALTRLGVNADLRDNNSALLVRKPEPGLPVLGVHRVRRRVLLLAER